MEIIENYKKKEEKERKTSFDSRKECSAENLPCMSELKSKYLVPCNSFNILTVKNEIYASIY